MRGVDVRITPNSDTGHRLPVIVHLPKITHIDLEILLKLGELGWVGAEGRCGGENRGQGVFVGSLVEYSRQKLLFHKFQFVARYRELGLEE